MNENRINARVDAATQRQLEELTLSTGQTISHVLREAVAVYHAQVKGARPRPERLLAMVGQYSSGRGDGSTNYKAIVAEAMEEKYGVAPRKKKARP
jgi:hypothetical protein